MCSIIMWQWQSSQTGNFRLLGLLRKRGTTELRPVHRPREDFSFFAEVIVSTNKVEHEEQYYAVSTKRDTASLQWLVED
jgi:hypothetical protein